MAKVDIRGLSKQYALADGAFYALKDFSAVIEDASFTVILGKSGCGKTTLLRLLGNLEARTSGEIEFSFLRTEKAGQRIGIVFQEPRLMPWLTVGENMGFSLLNWQEERQRKETVANYLAILGLEEFRDAYPAQLSGGMAQRVALGRTLCYDPDLILMDEPFGALDYFTRKRLQKELAALFLNQKKTIVFVTHDVPEAVYLGQKIIVMDSGTVVRQIENGLPYYRDVAAPEFLALQQEILAALGPDNMAGNQTMEGLLCT